MVDRASVRDFTSVREGPGLLSGVGHHRGSIFATKSGPDAFAKEGNGDWIVRRVWNRRRSHFQDLR